MKWCCGCGDDKGARYEGSRRELIKRGSTLCAIGQVAQSPSPMALEHSISIHSVQDEEKISFVDYINVVLRVRACASIVCALSARRMTRTCKVFCL